MPDELTSTIYIGAAAMSAVLIGFAIVGSAKKLEFPYMATLACAGSVLGSYFAHYGPVINALL